MSPALAPHGVLVVDKPSGPTSHDVVERVRRALGQRRAGHTGTLDPFATGVLAVCLGKATRLARFLSGGDKVYRATARLGFATTTDDAQGEPLSPARRVEVDLADVASACAAFIGEIDQLPPLFSAKHVAGRRLYEIARRGEAVERRASRVRVLTFEALALRGDEVDLLVRCGPGTYVRALARDLGDALGVGAHLTALRRTQSGDFDLGQAVTCEQLEERASDALLPMTALLTAWPALYVAGEGRLALRQGRPLDRRLVTEGFPSAPPPARLRVLDAESGALLALAAPRGFDVPAPGLSFEPCVHADVVLLE